MLLYALMPGRRSKAVLLGLLSVLFYAFGGIAQVPVLLLCALWNWLFGLALSREKGPRRLVCAAGISGDLALLCLYKYTGFLLGIFGSPAPAWTGAAPLGISFFTFHAVSYLADVYRDRSLAEKRPGLLFLYIAFFPRLLAGPILPWRAARSEPFGRAVSAEETAASRRTICPPAAAAHCATRPVWPKEKRPAKPHSLKKGPSARQQTESLSAKTQRSLSARLKERSLSTRQKAASPSVRLKAASLSEKLRKNRSETIRNEDSVTWKRRP